MTYPTVIFAVDFLKSVDLVRSASFSPLANACCPLSLYRTIISTTTTLAFLPSSVNYKYSLNMSEPETKQQDTTEMKRVLVFGGKTGWIGNLMCELIEKEGTSVQCFVHFTCRG